MADLVRLQKQRSGFKSRLTIYKNNFCIDSLKTVGSLEASLSLLRNLYQQYNVVQNSIEELADANDLTVFEDRIEFEKTYSQFEAQMLDKIDALKLKLNSNPKEVSASSVVPNISLRLPHPDKKLPTFDGNEINWLRFKEVYERRVHKNNELNNYDKYEYLIQCLIDGTAYTIIEFLPVTLENYETAYKLVHDNYNNVVSIKLLHMKSLTELKKPQENSGMSLQAFIDDCCKHYNALKSLGCPVEQWNLPLYTILIEKLDSKSKLDIVKKTNKLKLMTFDEFVSILRDRKRILDSTQVSCSNNGSLTRFANKVISKGVSHKFNKVFHSNILSCAHCKENHSLNNCVKFRGLELSPKRRLDLAQNYGVCINCLSGEHQIINCVEKPCSKCNYKHHELLHFSKKVKGNHPRNNRNSFGKPNSNLSTNKSTTLLANQSEIAANSEEATIGAGTSNVATALIESNQHSKGSTNLFETTVNSIKNIQQSQVLLPTALVWIQNSQNSKILVRALIDSGSQSHFITNKLCQQLNLVKSPSMLSVSGIDQSVRCIEHKVQVVIGSRISNFTRSLECQVLSKISNSLPSFSFNVEFSKNISAHPLADPGFCKANQIDLLLEAEIYSEIIIGDKILLHKELPPFINTVFGYIVVGKISYSPHRHKGSKQNSLTFMAVCQLAESKDSNSSNSAIVVLESFERLNDQIKKFWELENLPQLNLSIEEKLCEQHFKTHVQRDSQGRYMVRLPLKNNINDLGESLTSAMNQFLASERSLNRNPDRLLLYKQFMDEYLSLNHMAEITDINVINSCHGKTFYLPHHSVIKDTSTTTKLRVVFNATAKTSSGISLNDCLMVGPTIQADLFSLILRFRKHVIAFSGDIAKMYRQILISDEDQDLQRIFWRDAPDQPVKCYKLKTVTYGMASASYLATRTLKQLADDEKSQYQKASVVVKRDFYMDDVLTGADNISEAKLLKSDLIELLAKGGMELRKFKSNHSELSSDDPSCSTISVLGLQWETVEDQFIMPFKKFEVTGLCTKRSILSEIAQLFGPLGICGPVIFIAKSIMQSIWTLTNLSWDDPVPAVISEKWNKFKVQMINLRQISIPRCIVPLNSVVFELHGFGDASEKGFGCCIYLKCISSNGRSSVKLICAKSRVAPLRLQTIPRLELCAGLLLSQIMYKILAVMDIKFSSVYYWTDSVITLYRVNSNPGKYAVFVANRISQTQELSLPSDWRYVPTDVNPADIISRGLMPEELETAELWWNGPKFLCESPNLWPRLPSMQINSELLELRKTDMVLTSNTEQSFLNDLLNAFSNCNTLLRVTAFCLRFIKNCKLCKESRCKERLTATEVDNALKVLVGLVQGASFCGELNQLKKHGFVLSSSKLKGLAPFIDDDGLLRVGGRLSNADIDYDYQHQLLLPTSSNLSKLLASHEHIRTLHAGPQALLYTLRQRFWIINGRNICRKTVHSCVRCARTKPQITNQIMGQLPKSRVSPARPFLNVGIDFCGPFNIVHKLRSKVTTKSYVCVFVCFVSKAVHLEVVEDLSTMSFLACFRRFVSRRGLCSNVYSDNATNFVGCKTELKELQSLFQSEIHQTAVAKFCLNQNINWHTIPPRSPHFGGLWEAAVKSAKYHLKRVVGSYSNTLEEFGTIICQIEACLNSRPLNPMSEDPNDLSCLTPGHFLIGQPLNSLPDPSLQHLDFNRLSRYQRIQYMHQVFWKRWSNEYLSELQHRRKWMKDTENIKVGSMVILKDDNLPPLKWNLGRVTSVNMGNDGKIRVVVVRTANGEFKRAITSVCILPIET